MIVDHLAADIAVLATFSRQLEAQVRLLRGGELYRHRDMIIAELLELRRRADDLVKEWGDRL